MSGIEGTRHFVLGNDLEKVPEGHKVAVFANGCFWGSEKGIWRLPGDGIYSTAVGYCAGFSPNPTYEEACSGRTGHTEGVRVVGRAVCRGRTVFTSSTPASPSLPPSLSLNLVAHSLFSGVRPEQDQLR